MLRMISVPFILLSLVIASCSGEKPVREVAFIYSGNIGGKIEPCGCNPPLGGIPRRATLIGALREQLPDPLIIDAGALLYETNFLTPPLDHISRIEAGVLAKTIGIPGIDALNVTSFDLANSLDSLLAITNENSLPWVSANLARKATGEPLFPSERSFERNGVRIGVFGIMTDKFRGNPLFTGASPVQVVDPVETASREVKTLEADNDLVVALVYASRNDMEQIAREVDGIDVILHSHNDYHNPSSDHNAFTPYKIGDTLVISCPDGGRVLGILELTIAGDSMNFEPQPEGVSSPVSGKSTYLNTFIDLTADISSDPAVLALTEPVSQMVTVYRDSLMTAR